MATRSRGSKGASACSTRRSIRRPRSPQGEFASYLVRSLFKAAGIPLLHDDVLAWAECTTVHELEVGDHVLLVARVEDGGVQPALEPPLIYYRRSWGVWSPAQEPNEPDPVRIPSREVSGRDLRWQGAEM